MQQFCSKFKMKKLRNTILLAKAHRLAYVLYLNTKSKTNVMKRLLLLIIFSSAIKFSVAQTNRFQEISVTQSFIWNKTTIYDTYSGARARNKTGKAWSYGTNVNYSFGLNKKLYANAGIGYFNQRFGIHRGFDFYEPNVVTGLFYTTKNYSYKSFTYFGGIGYRIQLVGMKTKVLPENTEVRFLALFNIYNTFQQEFDNGGYHDPYYGNPQKRRNSYYYGTSLFLKGGLVRPIYKNFKIGVDLAVPVYNRWRKDEIFRENTSDFHGTDFSIGTSINLIYNLGS